MGVRIFFAFSGSSPLLVSEAAIKKGKREGITVSAQFVRPALSPRENSDQNVSKKIKETVPAHKAKKPFVFKFVTPIGVVLFVVSYS